MIMIMIKLILCFHFIIFLGSNLQGFSKIHTFEIKLLIKKSGVSTRILKSDIQ